MSQKPARMMAPYMRSSYQSDLGFHPGSRAWIVHTTTATMAAHNQRNCQPNPNLPSPCNFMQLFPFRSVQVRARDGGRLARARIASS